MKDDTKRMIDGMLTPFYLLAYGSVLVVTVLYVAEWIKPILP